MSVLKLYHALKARGVVFDLEGEKLIVDAPVGELTAEDREALRECKPMLVKLLTRRQEPDRDGDSEERRFDARPSRYPGYISLYDPLEGVWHDWPREDCEASVPSVVSLAEKKRKRAVK